jgi:hypothetical protein
LTILSVIQSVAAKVGIDPVPTSVFSESTRTAVELKETANECAAQIVRENDWNALLAVGEIDGDGLTTQFNLSTLIPDFQRLTKNAELWTDSQTYGNLYHIDNINDWLQQENWSIGWTGGAWTLYGGSLYVRAGTNALTEDQTIRFGYISKNYARAASPANTPKDAFTADTDTFVLNERLLKLCMIWNWKSAHGQTYSQEFEDYQNALEQLRIADRTPSIIRSGRRVPPYWPMGFR